MLIYRITGSTVKICIEIFDFFHLFAFLPHFKKNILSKIFGRYLILKQTGYKTFHSGEITHKQDLKSFFISS